MKWHDDDSFWQNFAPTMFTSEQWESAEIEITQVLTLADIAEPCDVLDLCCGPGRHSLALAERGFRVTGVDRMTAFLDEARERAAAAGVELRLVQEDMRRFVEENSFDLTLSLFTSFSYFADPAEDRQVLANVLRSLRPGGKFIIEMMSKEVLAHIFRERDWRETDDGLIVVEHREVMQDWGWIRSKWILLKGNERYETIVEHRLYSAVELKTLLLDVGFGAVKVFGNLDGGPYNHNAQRLVIVATK
ncbi:MAG TPA: methyltransferase domain-containing protein [bacterium]|nr:methyltransferase domain-containing protein [bacterium]